MNRILASSLGMTLGLLATAGRADEPVWRPARDRTPPPPAPAAPAPPALAAPTQAACWLGPPQSSQTSGAIIPVAATAPAADRGVWIRARGQQPDDVPLLPPPTPGPAPGTPTLPRVPTQSLVPPIPLAGNGMPIDAHPGVYPSYALPSYSLADQFADAGRAPRFLVSAEYLLWWTKGFSTPPLVTTSSPATGGILPGATVLLGGHDLSDTFRQGARFGTVWWMDDCASWGFDSRYFFTGTKRESFAANSNQFPNLFRPFFGANTLPPFLPGEFAERVTGVNAVTGVVETVGGVRADSRSRFWGGDTNYRDNICCWSDCTGGFRADLLAGFRYLNLKEDLTITEAFQRVTPDPLFNEPAGTQVTIRDRFATENDFYGGQLGTVLQYRYNRLTLDLRGTVALGTTHQRLTIEGGQSRLIPGSAPLLLQGGLLALNSNIGTRDRDVFSVVPEVGLNVGYQVTDHWRAYVGYNFLYWSNVIRPGDQIDRVIDVTRVPRFAPPTVPPLAVPRPAVLFKESDFWAQGVNLGLEFRW